MSMHPWRCSILALGALTLSLALSSCGKVADRNRLQLDSNTNWLVSCQADNQCSGSLRCYCGQCTQPCAQDDQCSRLSGAVCAESGEAVCGQQASPGGLCVLDCSQDNDCGENFSCNAGQCVPVPITLPEPEECRSDVFSDWDQLYSLVASDLSLQDPEDQPFLRYVSLGNRYLTGDCSNVAERQALSKLINSLSISATIERPAPINLDLNLFRIDLRDYDWDRAILVDGQIYRDGWEVLVANNPYAVPFVGDDADAVIDGTQAQVPLMLASPLLAVATQPEVYYGLLEIPDDLSSFWTDSLGIDRTTLPTVQAGFVDGSELLAQQWPMEVHAGYAWQISEVGRGPGGLFDNPLAPPLGGQELIFTLPNGLPAFAFSVSELDGRRLTRSSSFSDPSEADGLATAPRSSLRRHPLRVNVRDEVLDYVLANPSAFDAATAALIRQRFAGPAELALRLERDYETFTLPALESAGIDPGLAEPITLIASNFDRDVTLARAASELLVTPQELLDNLALLDPAMAVLDGGTLARSDFTQLYLESLCLLSVVLENQPSPEVCF